MTIRVFLLSMLHEPKHGKEYKIKVNHTEKNIIRQVKKILVFFVILNFQNTLHEKYHCRLSVENVFLCITQDDL